MKFILSPVAILDLQSISEYTLETWGAEQEEFYLKSLWEKLAAIQSAPEKIPATRRPGKRLPLRPPRKACHLLRHSRTNAPDHPHPPRRDGLQ